MNFIETKNSLFILVAKSRRFRKSRSTVLLAATALLATVIPAFRATRVDPIVALREE